jgi:hypothetical protein
LILILDINKVDKKEEEEMVIKKEMILEINNLIQEEIGQEVNIMMVEDLMKDAMISFMIEEKMVVVEKKEVMGKNDSKEIDKIEFLLISNSTMMSLEKWREKSSSRKKNNTDFTKSN